MTYRQPPSRPSFAHALLLQGAGVRLALALVVQAAIWLVYWLALE